MSIAKNYLSEEELSVLNNLVEQYLIFAEGQAMHRISMNMADWIVKLDGFLSLNDRNILDHAGKISHQIAKQTAEQEYDKFHQRHLEKETEQADEVLEKLSKITGQIPKKDKDDE